MAFHPFAVLSHVLWVASLVLFFPALAPPPLSNRQETDPRIAVRETIPFLLGLRSAAGRVPGCRRRSQFHRKRRSTSGWIGERERLERRSQIRTRRCPSPHPWRTSSPGGPVSAQPVSAPKEGAGPACRTTRICTFVSLKRGSVSLTPSFHRLFDTTFAIASARPVP